MGTLYDNAPLSVSASWQAIMHFSLTNHLSYNAMNQLLGSIKIHLSSNAILPNNIASFKKKFVETVPAQYLFYSECFSQLEMKATSCDDSICKEKAAAVCYFYSCLNYKSLEANI